MFQSYILHFILLVIVKCANATLKVCPGVFFQVYIIYGKREEKIFRMFLLYCKIKHKTIERQTNFFIKRFDRQGSGK